MRLDLLKQVSVCVLALALSWNHGYAAEASDPPPLLRVAGSSTVLPVADAWSKLIPDNYTYSIEGGGSSSGARRVCAWYDDATHVDIGCMSRNWRSSEAVRLDDGVTLECLDKETGELTGQRVTQLQVGIDGLAVVVKNNGAAHSCLTDPAVGGLTMAQLRWIFSDWTDAELASTPHGGVDIESVIPGNDGDGIKHWSDIHSNCQKVPINTYGAGDQSGTYEFFADATFNGDIAESFPFCNLTEVHYLEGLDIENASKLIRDSRDQLGDPNCYAPSEDDDLIYKWILADTGGIAFFGYAHYSAHSSELTVARIADDRVKGIGDTQEYIVTPSTFSITDGSYSVFTRTLFMNIDNNAWDLVRFYLKTGYSDRGQVEVDQVGYVGVNAAVRARMQTRIRDGENLEADYVPVEPECSPGTELFTTQYMNPFGKLKNNYTCQACSIGTFRQSITQTACDPCLAGRFANTTGQSICEPCARGSKATGTGATACNPCSPGTYTAFLGATSCAACRVGTAQAFAGATECAGCPLGTYQGATGGRTCLVCEPGSYAASDSLTECIKCDPGYSQSERGAERPCSRCTLGHYADSPGTAECAKCNDGLTTQFTGAYSLANCVCEEGSYMPRGSNASMVSPCKPCPAGMFCAIGSGETYLPTYMGDSFRCPADMQCNYPLVDTGHMTTVSNPLKVYKCLLEEQCPGGDPGVCAAHRDASEVACGLCEDDAFESGDTCEKCGDGPNILFIIGTAILFVLMLIAAAICVNTDSLKQSGATVSVAVITGLVFTGLQSLGVFSSLNLTWFEPMKSIIEVLSVVGFDLSVLRVSCQIGSSPVTHYLARQLVAPMAALLLGVVILVKKICTERSLKFFVEWVNTVGAIYSIFFISVVISAMSPFICYKHPGSNGSSVVSQPSVLCYEDGPWLGLMVAGIMSILVVIAPFLGICSYGTWNYQHMVSKHKPDQLNMFKFLFMRFKADRYYYGGILLTRNFAIPLIPALVRGDIAFQVVLMVGVVLAFLVVQMTLLPWRTFLVNLFDACLSSVLILVLISGTASSDFKAEETSIMWLGTVVFSLVLAIVLAVLCKALMDRFFPLNAFDGFICHHKAGAASQARYLKMCLATRGKMKIFIDSDDLKQLDGLFDIVRCQVSKLIVYLSRGTLSRPWCCGEIATAYVNRVTAVSVHSVDFVMPENRGATDWFDLLDFHSSCLVQYGFDIETVKDAYAWLLESNKVQQFHIRSQDRGRARVENIASALLGKSVPTFGDTEIRVDKDAVVVSSDPTDDEASASAGILLSHISERVLALNVSHINCLSDVDMQRYVTDEQKLEEIVLHARASIVILTPHTMQSLIQLKVIIIGVARNAFNVVPVATSLYHFPTETYYEKILPSLLKTASEKERSEASAAVRAFFKTIAVPLNTHASAMVIETQAIEVYRRIPQIRMSTMSSKSSKTIARLSLLSGADKPQPVMAAHYEMQDDSRLTATTAWSTDKDGMGSAPLEQSSQSPMELNDLENGLVANNLGGIDEDKDGADWYWGCSV